MTICSLSSPADKEVRRLVLGSWPHSPPSTAVQRSSLEPETALSSYRRDHMTSDRSLAAPGRHGYLWGRGEPQPSISEPNAKIFPAVQIGGFNQDHQSRQKHS